ALLKQRTHSYAVSCECSERVEGEKRSTWIFRVQPLGFDRTQQRWSAELSFWEHGCCVRWAFAEINTARCLCWAARHSSHALWGVQSGRSSLGGRRTNRELLRLPWCCTFKRAPFKSKAEGLVALAAGGRCSMPGMDNPRQHHGSHLAD
ncbi:unnamed protein product, partial [Ectocarpus sp. 8 AP-2014]